jgi:hypothetical protein
MLESFDQELKQTVCVPLRDYWREQANGDSVQLFYVSVMDAIINGKIEPDWWLSRQEIKEGEASKWFFRTVENNRSTLGYMGSRPDWSVGLSMREAGVWVRFFEIQHRAAVACAKSVFTMFPAFYKYIVGLNWVAEALNDAPLETIEWVIGGHPTFLRGTLYTQYKEWVKNDFEPIKRMIGDFKPYSDSAKECQERLIRWCPTKRFVSFMNGGELGPESFASGVVTIFTECIFPKHYYDFDGSNFGYDLFSIRREKLEYSILIEFGTSEMRACVK